MVVGTLAGLLGLALSYTMYFKPSPLPARLASQLGPLYRASLHKFYIDELYTSVIVWPTRLLGVTAKFSTSPDRRLVQGVSWVPRLVGRYLLGPDPERPDPVLRGRDRPERGRVAADPVVLRLIATVLSETQI